MYPASFDYHAPTTLNEALTLFERHQPDAKLLAGGQSLIPLMKLRLLSPPVVIDLGRIAELAAIREEAGTIVIGAMATHDGIASSDLVKKRVPLLTEVAESIGDIQVRNLGTIGGSVAHADPAADWPAALLALDATCVVRTGKGSRSIPASEFFVGLMTTALASGEMLTEIRIPIPKGGGHAYEKVAQPASGFALVGIAVQLEQQGDRCEKAAIALTGVGTHAIRASASEKLLNGRRLDGKAFSDAAERVVDQVEVQGDLHASPEFRGHLARVHVRRALSRAAGIAPS